MPSALHTHHDGPANAAPVVLAGSLGTDLTMWQGVVDRMSLDHHVTSVDLPGHGRSRHVAASTHLSDLSAALLEVLEAAGPPPCHVVGCSLGGMAAMQLAAERPDVVSSLTLTCTSAHLGVPDVWQDRAARVRAEGMAAIAARVVDRWFPTATRRDRPELVARCRAMLLATNPEAYATYCELLAELDLRTHLPRIACPTLVVAGGADAAIPMDHARRLAGGVRGAALRVMDGAGHLAPADSPSDVAILVRKHMSEASGPAGYPNTR